MKKLTAIILAVLMLTALISGCKKSEPKPPVPNNTTNPTESNMPAAPQSEAKDGGVLILRSSDDPRSFCPSLDADDKAETMFSNMFNRLVKLDVESNLIPDAAESWDVSDDALTITFHLKKNMHWWDNEAFDAEDVKYTFDYLKTNPTCLFNAEMKVVDSIEIADPYTVVFHMNTADMSFIVKLSTSANFIVPEHIYNNGQPWEDNPAAKTSPVGSGPFMFEEYKRGESITLIRNPNYHDGAPHLDKLIFSIIPDKNTTMQALLGGEVDHVSNIPDAYVEQLLANPNFRCDKQSRPDPLRYVFNMKNPAVGDIAIRKAIALCIDRHEISEKVTSGIMYPEYCAFPSMFTWCVNTVDKYPEVDIAAARKVLEDAGYKADGDGFYVRGLTVDCYESQAEVDMTRLLVANCAKAGIELELLVSDLAGFEEKICADDPVWMIECQSGTLGPDPSMLASRFGTGYGMNFGFFSNAEFDELCAKGMVESDTEKRAEYYRQAQKILVEQLPVINVLRLTYYGAARSDLADLPIDGAGKWGEREYTFAYYTGNK